MLLFVFPLFSFGQIKISENIQKSLLTKNDDNSLYFVDFWATWCGPCIHASKYLTSLQRQYPNRFHIMSLSQENPDIVKRFMKKHALELAVAIDYNGETFSKFNIASLPYGILFNAKGERLWEGHPAEFKSYHLDGFLSTNKKTVSVDKMYQLQSFKPAAVTKSKTFKGDFDIISLKEATTPLRVDKKLNFLELTGSLKAILAYTNSVYLGQIKGEGLQTCYRTRFKYNTEAFQNKTKEILQYLKLSQNETIVNGEVLFFDIQNSNFWDVHQIDWGNDTPNFLIGDSDIKADNVSLNQVNYQISNLLNMPIVTNNSKLAEGLHDWEIHYKYFDLMAASLNDIYGIRVEKRIGEYKNYIISKKTP
ncbi:redoxin family protein [Hyunsoonleella ulvae]|uniref:redoxin family protein n=1 Tax=Hyunsoonleella ulvae TaxID=2799948 RepID=UPI0019392F68|nr:redoxin family protein [Hyunsoonleella ulvae]